MTCMEVDGMKRVLFNILLPGIILAVWMNTCFYVCRKPEGFDFFLYWMLVGFPYGIRKMCLVLIPRNFSLGISLAILALNGIVGGLIGGIVVVCRIIDIAVEIISIITAHFRNKKSKC